MLQVTDQNPDMTGKDIVHKDPMLGVLGPACIHKLYAGANGTYLRTVDVDLSGSTCIQSELSKRARCSLQRVCTMHS